MRIRLGGVIALATAGLLAGSLVPANAGPEQEKSRVDASVRELRTDLDESTERLAGASAAFQAAEAKLPGARAAATSAAEQFSAAQARDAEMQRKLDEAVAAEKAAEAQLRVVAARVAETKRLIGRFARRTYQQGALLQLSVVLQARTPAELLERFAVVRTVLRSESAALDRLHRAQAELTQQERELAARRSEVTARREEAAQQLRDTQQLNQQAQTARQQVQALVKEREDAKVAAQRERARDLASYNVMRAEQQKLERMIRELARQARERNARDSDDFPDSSLDGDGYLSRPTYGLVTSGFGYRLHPLLGYRRMHTGTDFRAATGTPIFTAASGRVISTGSTAGYGRRVIVEHGEVNGVYLVTTYNHLSSISVHVGQRVSRGQQVGKAGATGLATAPHLHFEVLVDGSFQDPMKWL